MASTEDSIGQRTTQPTGSRRLVIAVGLLLITTLGYIDRVNMSVAAPHVIDQFGLSKGRFRIASSAFNWTYALFLVPVAVLADRVGTKVMLPLAIVIWSLGAGATGLATGLASLIAARLLMGVGESPVFPAGNLVIREWAPATERGRVSGLLNAGQLVGPAIGAVVAAYLINVFGWRASFFILGLFGVLVGLIWYAAYSRPEIVTFIDFPWHRLYNPRLTSFERPHERDDPRGLPLSGALAHQHQRHVDRPASAGAGAWPTEEICSSIKTISRPRAPRPSPHPQETVA